MNILKSALFFSCLTVANFIYGQGKQECKCPELRVMVYDFDNSAAKPTWYKGGPVTSANYTNEQLYEFADWQHAPQSGSSGFLNTSKQQNHEIHFFDKQVSNGDVDYIATGKFIRVGDHFLLQVQLQDAKNGDHFAELSIQLPTLKTAQEAGGEVAAKLSPLLKTIRKYQHEVRDEKRKDQTAISAKYELTSDKTDLKINETSEVKLKMYDCDDNLPLKNRKVKLKILDGKSTLSPSEVTTDGNGEAKTTFKAGSKSEKVTVYAEYQYTSVTNRNSIAGECGDDLRMNVKGYYKLTVEFEASGHGDNGAKYHALVKGETEVNIKSENDCYAIEMAHGNEMEFHVQEVIFQSDQGSATYKAPGTFTTPVTISVDCNKDPKFKIAFSSFGDPQETYSTSDGADFRSPLLNSLVTATLGSVNLARMQKETQDLKQKADNPKDKQAETDAAAKRLNQHKNDPDYLKSPQGKADMAMLHQGSKNIGDKNDDFRPDPKRMQNLENLKAQNALQQKINQKFTQPGYVGSGEYENDKQEIARLSGKVDLNSLANAAGFDMTLLQIEAPFAVGVNKPVDKVQKDKITDIAGSQSGWEFGQFHITIEQVSK